jgi:hypothetical protein
MGIMGKRKCEMNIQNPRLFSAFENEDRKNYEDLSLGLSFSETELTS